MNRKTLRQWFALVVLLLMGTATATVAQSLTIDDFQIKAGETKTVAVKLDKGTLESVYSVQADFACTEGLSIATKTNGKPDMTLVEGVLDGWSIATNVLNSGNSRVSVLSLEGDFYTGEPAEIINIKVTAADDFERGTITISNIEFAISNKGATHNPEASTCNVTKEEEEQPVSSYYEKVTSTSGIVDGEYLIVYETGNLAFDGSLSTLDNTSNVIDVTINEGKIASSETVDAATFTIDVTAGTLKSASGYYIGVSSNSNGLKQTDDADTYANTFTIDDSGNATITAVFNGSTMSLRYNKASNQNRFRYYKNAGQEAIALYKKVGGGDTPTPIETITNPLASLANGTYEGPQTVELTCETEGAAIYYTLDGTDPTAESTLYTEALTISETTTLKAIAIKGELRSAIVEYTYTIVPVAERATFDFDAYEGPFSSNSSNDGDITANLVITEGDVTMTITPSNATTNNRYWGSSPKMRMYGGRMIMEAAEGKAIVKVEITSGKWDTGNTFNGETAANGTWEGNSTNVVLKVAGNTQMNKVVVTLAEASEATTTYDDPDAEDPEVTAARQELLNEIQTATGLLGSETATDEQKQALQAAINAAQAVADNADATKEELQAALGELKVAEETYLTPTAITTIDAAVKAGEAYNLQGQKVQHTGKGIYIVNGKKLMK